MSSIHSFQVGIFQGMLHEAVQRVGILDSQPGQDDNVLSASGWSSEADRVTTLTWVSGGSLAAKTVGESYRARCSLTGSVVDQFGLSWSNVRVRTVVYDLHRTIVSGQFIVEAHWELLTAVQRPPGR